ncbi:hypothetical protein H0H92_006272 [Tricholoma furcatifolium]|nr:hypothetical protein H0H92_006272 [Tricholoma furcatifolium]
MLAEPSEMYHKHLGVIRHRPFTRNLAYALLFFTCLYILNRAWQSDSGYSYSYGTGRTALRPPVAWEETAAQVRRAFLHAYHGYERYAAPYDELRPLTNNGSDVFNGWGVTIFDSLDTMLIMDLKNEYARAINMVQRIDFSLPDGSFTPYFETVIRYLGGLLSAYALSKNQLFLDRADDLATKLDPIFNTTSGLALFGVNPTNGEVIGPEVGILAEIASLQLEYTYLAKLTGKKEHYHRASTVFKAFENANLRFTNGMLPVKWNLTSGQPYDYLRATTHIITRLLYLSPTRHLLYVTDEATDDRGYTYPSHVFEHLSCFLPGLLALGAHTLPLDDLESIGITLDDIDSNGAFGTARKNHETLAQFDLKKLHLWAAEGLAQTCYLSYADQPTGLGPDVMVFKTKPETRVWDKFTSSWKATAPGDFWIDAMKKWKGSGGRGIPPGLEEKKPVVYATPYSSSRLEERDYDIRRSGYLLRPEAIGKQTVESFYILWRVTGDLKWRERGWRIFTAIEEVAKTPSGYASLKVVDMLPPRFADEMPRLKYLYLLFINDDPIPLDQWVFNTEAHPFPVFEWTAKEREEFGIA